MAKHKDTDFCMRKMLDYFKYKADLSDSWCMLSHLSFTSSCDAHDFSFFFFLDSSNVVLKNIFRSLLVLVRNLSRKRSRNWYLKGRKLTRQSSISLMKPAQRLYDGSPRVFDHSVSSRIVAFGSWWKLDGQSTTSQPRSQLRGMSNRCLRRRVSVLQIYSMCVSSMSLSRNGLHLRHRNLMAASASLQIVGLLRIIELGLLSLSTSSSTGPLFAFPWTLSRLPSRIQARLWRMNFSVS